MLLTSRAELITLLARIGVDLPPQTKLPQEELEKRLRKALDCTQQINHIASETPSSFILPTASLKPWPSDAKTSLELAFQRTNWEEQAMLDMHPHTPDSGYLLMDLKTKLVNFAAYGKQGRKLYIIQDKEQDSSIIIRLIDILAIDEKTPVAVVLYHHCTADMPHELRGFDWVENHEKAAQVTGRAAFMVSTLSIEAQQLFLRLLEMNSKRLPNDYVIAREKFESRFKSSFLLPIGPLDVKDSYKLNSKTGCVACGGKADKRCVACLAVYYCSPECQKADWKAHKPICNSLKGATWTPIPIKHMEAPKGGIILRLHKQMEPGKFEDVPAGDEPPQDTHGVQPFLVKLQCNSSLHSLQNTGGIMVYDKRRSIDVIYPRSVVDAEATRLYDEILGKIRSEGIGSQKMFFWVRRTGDWELSLALNRLPAQDAKW